MCLIFVIEILLFFEKTFIEFSGNGFKAVNKQRIEFSAFSCAYHLYSLIMRYCVFVAAYTGERIINICHRNNLRRNRYLVSCKSVRISSAVPSLMMPSADSVCNSYKRIVGICGNFVKQCFSQLGMFLHNLPFLCGKLAGFVKDIIRYGYLADIMQRRQCRNRCYIRL